MRRLCIAIAMAVALSTPALAALDLVKGSAERTEATISSFVPDSSGNQDWVREYDGRHFNALGLEYLESQGYNGPIQYAFDGRDLTLGDEDILFGIAYKNWVGMNFYTSSLLHRQPLTPLDNPALNGTAAAGGDHLLDLGPAGQSYGIDRTVTDFGIRMTPPELMGARLVTDWWQESEEGVKQQQFRAREAKAGVIPNRQKGLAAIPVDRETNQATLGTDIPIGSSTVVNYRFYDTKFAENGGRPAPGSNEDFLPLNRLTQPKNDTTNSVFKARTNITKNLFFTGVHTSKKRENRAGGLPASASVDIGSTNMALTYFPMSDLTVTGRYRTFNYDNESQPVIVGGVQANSILSHKTSSMAFDSTYTGVAKTFLKLGYERQNTDRDPVEGDEIPQIRASSDSNIWRAGFRYYPSTRFSLSSNLEKTNTDNSGFTGVPDDRTKVAVNATYMLRDNLGFYGDFNKLNESNNETRVPLGDIVTPATNATQAEERELAAGQGYSSTLQTMVLGTWFAVNPKLTLDMNYAKINMDSAALWLFGSDPAYTPHLLPNYVPFKSHNNQFTVGATYAFTPKVRVYGNVARSFTTGKSIIDPAKYPGNLGPAWSPFEATENTFSVGCAYDVSTKDKIELDLSSSNWTDAVNPANDGRFGLARVAWNRSF